MLLDLNRATIIGTMVTDPELRMAGTKPVCNFRLSVNRYTKDGNKAEYINVVCWDKLAENISTYLTKGSRLYAEGRLQTREWTANDGQKKTTTEIVASDILFLDKKDAPARSIQSISSITNVPGLAVTSGTPSADGSNYELVYKTPLNTESFVLESMDKQDNVQEIKLSDIPF